MSNIRNQNKKGDPRIEARRQRAQARAKEHVCTLQCKRFRTGKVPWPTKV